MARQDTDYQKFRRRLNAARREINSAVNRAAEVDLLPGHVAEARRLAQQVKDAADELVTKLDERASE